MRILTALALVPFMKLSGFRFSKNFRQGATRRHRLAYAVVDTVAANTMAGLKFTLPSK